jgi:hypothetical protein
MTAPSPPKDRPSTKLPSPLLPTFWGFPTPYLARMPLDCSGKDFAIT